MTTPILISGSMAYDSIMVYHGKFRDQIMPEAMHILNLVFLVPTMRREFGGCAGNIAYSLHLLGGNPHIMASVGGDFAPYADRLTRLGITQSGIHTHPDQFTAQAFIITDEDDNQITAFHPGAMGSAHLCTLPINSGAKWGMVSPNGKEAMMTHLRAFSAEKINVIFDPGQGLPMFSGDELKALLPHAHALIVNDYELKLFCDKTGLSDSQIAAQVKTLIVTLGGEGCDVWMGGEKTRIPAMKVETIVDPTGCGDSFRGALLYSLSKGLGWVESAKVGNIVAGVKIASAGPQNYTINKPALAKLYEEHYREKLPNAL